MLASVMLGALSVMMTISLVPVGWTADGATSDDPSAAADAVTEGEDDDEEEEDTKPFAEVVEGFEVIDGLFTFYRDDETNQVYMEIAPEQLGVVYLCDVAREAGDGD